MAKRFTATEKWTDPWFCRLSDNNKLFWLYLLDNCDNAGIWRVNWFIFGCYVKNFIYKVELFKNRIIVLDDEKWFIPKFIEFQYGKLNPACLPHLSVIRLLEKHTVTKGYLKGMLTLKDKEKDKDMVKAMVKDSLIKSPNDNHTNKDKDNTGIMTAPEPVKHKETAEQYIVRQFKIALGVPELDKEWDKKRFSYCVKFASGIIAAFDGDKKYATDWVDRELESWQKWVDKSGGKISLPKIEAAAWDQKGKYLEEKALKEKRERREGNYDSQHLAKTMVSDYAVGQVKTSGLTQIGEAIAPKVNK